MPHRLESVNRGQSPVPLPLWQHGAKPPTQSQNQITFSNFYQVRELNTFILIKADPATLTNLAVQFQRSSEQLIINSIKRALTLAQQQPDSFMSDMYTHRLLAVDDEISNLNFYKVSLSRLPVEVDTATSGSEAFDLLKTKQYDLMVLDLLMPDGTGIGLLQKAAQEQLALPIVLVCSSMSDKAIIAQALSLGASGYLKKPLTYQQLLQAVCDYLNLPYPPTPAASSSIQSVPKPERHSIEPHTPAHQPLTSGSVHSLTHAMSVMTIYKQTGKVKVYTASGTGVLEYEKGRLKSVSYAGKTSIDALEALRIVTHHVIQVELNNT